MRLDISLHRFIYLWIKKKSIAKPKNIAMVSTQYARKILMNATTRFSMVVLLYKF